MRSLAFACAAAGLLPMSPLADDIQFYQPSSTSAPESLFGLDARGLTGQIEVALAEYTGFSRLRSIAVHWDLPTFRCLTRSYEHYEVQYGVCLVEVSAFQVAATALVVKGERKNTLEVSILNAVIE